MGPPPPILENNTIRKQHSALEQHSTPYSRYIIVWAFKGKQLILKC